MRAQAEERFKTAVAAFGDENEGTQVGGAILLRSFLNPNDKEPYGRYYNQILDLAVAYLRLSSLSKPSYQTLTECHRRQKTLTLLYLSPHSGRH